MLRASQLAWFTGASRRPCHPLMPNGGQGVGQLFFLAFFLAYFCYEITLGVSLE